MVLVDWEITQARDRGSVVIEPFVPEQVGPNSYDVRLGHLWCLDTRFGWYFGQGELTLQPGAFALCHTLEKIGGRAVSDHAIHPTFHTRSTLARSGLAMHLGAGFGDAGYVWHWTLEVYNHRQTPQTLVPGTRIGQIAFQRCERPLVSYGGVDRYQCEARLAREITHQDLLPKAV